MSEPSKHQLAVWEKVVNVGPAKCKLCETMRADCVQFSTGLLSRAVICDSCASELLKMFRRDVGGDAR